MLWRLDGDRGSGFLTAQSGVLDLLQDHEGGLWVALLTQGLAYLPRTGAGFRSGTSLTASRWTPVPVECSQRWPELLCWLGTWRVPAGCAGNPAVAGQRSRDWQRAVWSVLPRPDGRLWLGRAGRISVYDPATGAFARWRIDGGADLRQRVDLMRQAPDGTVWLSVMNLGLQQQPTAAYCAATLEDFRKTADSPIEQIRFDAQAKAWVMGDMGIWREQAGRFECRAFRAG